MQTVRGWSLYGTNLTLEATTGGLSCDVCARYVLLLPSSSCGAEGVEMK